MRMPVPACSAVKVRCLLVRGGRGRVQGRKLGLCRMWDPLLMYILLQLCSLHAAHTYRDSIPPDQRCLCPVDSMGVPPVGIQEACAGGGGAAGVQLLLLHLRGRWWSVRVEGWGSDGGAGGTLGTGGAVLQLHSQ